MRPQAILTGQDNEEVHRVPPLPPLLHFLPAAAYCLCGVENVGRRRLAAVAATAAVRGVRRADDAGTTAHQSPVLVLGHEFAGGHREGGHYGNDNLVTASAAGQLLYLVAVVVFALQRRSRLGEGCSQ